MSAFSTTGDLAAVDIALSRLRLYHHFLPAGAAAVFWKLYVPPNFLLNRSTRPAVSTNFCFPVKNGWQALQISTLIFAVVLRVTNVFPQAQWTAQVMYLG